jgi:hypothetical protein
MAQPLTWVVIEHKFGRARLISKHASQREAEAERGRRNSAARTVPSQPASFWSPRRSG